MTHLDEVGDLQNVASSALDWIHIWPRKVREEFCQEEGATDQGATHQTCNKVQELLWLPAATFSAWKRLRLNSLSKSYKQISRDKP